jgi:hypothetical protein
LLPIVKKVAGWLRRYDQYDARHSKREEARLIMASPHDIDSARLRMLEVRKALEDYETLEGVAWSCEYSWQIQVFSDASGTYLKLSANQ